MYTSDRCATSSQTVKERQKDGGKDQWRKKERQMSNSLTSSLISFSRYSIYQTDLRFLFLGYFDFGLRSILFSNFECKIILRSHPKFPFFLGCGHLDLDLFGVCGLKLAKFFIWVSGIYVISLKMNWIFNIGHLNLCCRGCLGNCLHLILLVVRYLNWDLVCISLLLGFWIVIFFLD